MSADEPAGETEEKIRIMATDDEKIKSFGEVLTNDSSREILQLLFNDCLSAAQIAQKTGISLQLARYHLHKLQDLGVVRISGIEKNSKSQDMKIYSAAKFSIVIVPPKLSEKTKKSKMLVMSFRHIYKVAGLGIAAGFSGLLSLSALTGGRPAPAVDKPPDPAPGNADLSAPVASDLPESDESGASEPQTGLDDGPGSLQGRVEKPTSEEIMPASVPDRDAPIISESLPERDYLQEDVAESAPAPAPAPDRDAPVASDLPEPEELEMSEPMVAPDERTRLQEDVAEPEPEPALAPDQGLPDAGYTDAVPQAQDLAYDLAAYWQVPPDLFLPLAALTGILAALAGYFLWRLPRRPAPAS